MVHFLCVTNGYCMCQQGEGRGLVYINVHGKVKLLPQSQGPREIGDCRIGSIWGGHPGGPLPQRQDSVQAALNRGWQKQYSWRICCLSTSPFLFHFQCSCVEAISAEALGEISSSFLALWPGDSGCVVSSVLSPHFINVNEIMIISNIFICSLKANR